jgi:hypothetical protein
MPIYGNSTARSPVHLLQTAMVVAALAHARAATTVGCSRRLTPTASLELSLPRTVDAALAGNTAVPQASRAARHRVRHLHSGVTRAATAPVAAKAGAAARVLALGDFVKFGHL